MTDLPNPVTPLPDGIRKQNLERDRGFRRHASVVSLCVLGAIVAIALSGVLGGSGDSHLTAENDRVVLTYEGPTLIRNGMFFEAHVHVTARQPIKKLELSLDPSLERDITMNSMIPAAADETFKDGAFRYTFDKLDAGDKFDVKFDFQINPSLFAGNEGDIAVYDGDAKLATLPVSITVFP
ncbi:MAG: hypothetical protein ACTHJ3_09800 [Pararhizobium sp.]